MADEQAFYEREYAPCACCEGSGVDPADDELALCPACGGFGEVEIER